MRAFLNKYFFSDNLPIAARRLNILYFIGALSAALVLFMRIYIQASLYLVLIIAAIIGLCVLMFYLANRFKLFSVLTWVTSISVCLILFPLAFFTLGGTAGSISAYFVLASIVIFFVHEGKPRIIMLGIYYAITAACFLIGLYYPDFVSPLTENQILVDGYLSFVIISLCVGFIVVQYTNIYERENARNVRITALLHVVNESAETLLTAQTDRLDTLLTQAMGALSQPLDLDRMYIWQCEQHDGKLMYIQRYSWAATEEHAASSLAGRSGTGTIPCIEPWENNFRNKRAINGPIALLSKQEQELLKTYNVQSILVIPIYVDGEFWGFVSLDDCHSSRTFSQEEVRIVSSASSMLINSISRAMLRDELEESLDKALSASKAKGDFLSNMSHEMRTPMNAIIGMTSIAKQSDDIERKDYALDKIEDASTHLIGVINDILDMSKIEANKLELSEVEFGFEKMLRKVVNVVNFRIEERKQHFFVSIDRRIPDHLIGDDQRLSQVITNLLSNAIKFTPEDGTVRLDTHLVSEHEGECTIQIEIVDTGIGISAEQQSRLFSAFEQASSGTSRKFGGTGLGLAISKRIVELMGGHIWIESELGEGATFAFTAMFKKGTEALNRQEQATALLSDLKILVVDDEPEVGRFFADICARFGMSCDTAISGDAALALIAEGNRYDFAFIDWVMPGMNGLELSQRLQTSQVLSAEEQPILVMISAMEWSDIEQDARAAGVQKHLTKPLLPSDILDVITDSLGYKSLSEAKDEGSRYNEVFPDTTILLAEDIEINQEIVLALLEPTQIEVVVAGNGLAALETFKENPEHFDMILMDVQMPEMDGLEATRAIRALDIAYAQEIPIVAMTANVYREDIENCLAAGMNDHVGKPINLEELLDKLSFYLQKNAEGRKNAQAAQAAQANSAQGVAQKSALPSAKQQYQAPATQGTTTKPMGNTMSSQHQAKEVPIMRYGQAPEEQGETWNQGIAWTQDLETGHDDIDAQHKHLFGLVSALACNAGDSDDAAFEQTLTSLVLYTVRHFAQEETLQRDCGYPDYERHKQLHEAFRNEVVAFVKAYHTEGKTLEMRRKLYVIVARWLISHIKREDFKIAEHIRANSPRQN